MTSKLFLIITLFFATLFFATGLSSCNQNKQKQSYPNIIFILADDMSYDSVSHFNPQIGNMKTPHLDRLAQEGMYFTDGHSGSSVCTPTRYGILTGRYCWRSELKSEVLWTYGRPLIEKERLTVADILKAKGYNTACIGKWHLGIEWPGKDGKMANRNLKILDKTWGNNKDANKRVAACEKQIDFSKAIKGPREQGFDYFFGVDLPNMSPYAWIENDHLTAQPTVPKPDKMFGSKGLMVPGWKLEDVLPGLASRTHDWIQDASKEDKPFFLYMPLTSPHTPIVPSKKFLGKSGISKYADFVIETDWVVGHVMEALDKAGVTDNTLVIFSTDNGTSGAANFKELKSKGVDLNYHFRGNKLSIYEGGHRIPFIVRWPGKTKPGTSNDETVCLNDFMATVADIIDYPLPDNAAEDSSSILPLITGKAKALPSHPGVISHDYGGGFCIRKDSWKLIFPRKAKGKYALYDLNKDIKETKNVADKHPQIVKELTQTLKTYVENGRSTPGKKQQNFQNKNTWPGLPWSK